MLNLFFEPQDLVFWPFKMGVFYYFDTRYCGLPVLYNISNRCYNSVTVKQRNATYRVACCHCIRHPSWVGCTLQVNNAQLKPAVMCLHTFRGAYKVAVILK